MSEDALVLEYGLLGWYGVSSVNLAGSSSAVAVDLVGGDVVVADAIFADGLQQAEGALHVGAQERLRVGDGVVVVALCGVVHDRVVAGDDPIEQLRVADVTDDELDPVLGQPRDVLGVAGVGQLVQTVTCTSGWFSTT